MTSDHEMMDDMAAWAVNRPWRMSYRLVRSTTPLDSLYTITDMGIRMLFAKEDPVAKRGDAAVYVVVVMGLCVLAGLYVTGVLK